MKAIYCIYLQLIFLWLWQRILTSQVQQMTVPSPRSQMFRSESLWAVWLHWYVLCYWCSWSGICVTGIVGFIILFYLLQGWLTWLLLCWYCFSLVGDTSLYIKKKTIHILWVSHEKGKTVLLYDNRKVEGKEGHGRDARLLDIMTWRHICIRNDWRCIK